MNDDPERIDIDIKQLDKELKLEELRNLRQSRRYLWLNPMAFGIILPIVGAAGLFILNEVRGYNAAYKAFGEVEVRRQEAKDLRLQKANLSQEIVAMLALKDHFSAEAKRLEELLNERQTLADQFYLRAKYAAHESMYALDLAQNAGERISVEDMAAVLNKAKKLDSGSQDVLQELAHSYQFFFDMSDVSGEQLAELIQSLSGISPSPVALALQWQPSGAVVTGRQVMTDFEEINLYDIELGRFLMPAEIDAFNDPSSPVSE